MILPDENPYAAPQAPTKRDAQLIHARRLDFLVVIQAALAACATFVILYLVLTSAIVMVMPTFSPTRDEPLSRRCGVLSLCAGLVAGWWEQRRVRRSSERQSASHDQAEKSVSRI